MPGRSTVSTLGTCGQEQSMAQPGDAVPTTGPAAGCHTAMSQGDAQAAGNWRQPREGGLLGMPQALPVKQSAVQTK